MLYFKKLEISYLEFIKSMEAEYSVDLSDPKEHEDVLYSFCSERLTALRGNYPNIYTFLGASPKSYLLVFGENEQDRELYEVSYDKKRQYRMAHTPAEVFVINESPKWGKESRLAVYDSYGIRDCAYEPLDDQEVRIWCQRQWHEEYRDMPANQFVDTDDQKLNSISEANDYIDGLIKKDYKLEPYELARPNYIITY